MTSGNKHTHTTFISNDVIYSKGALNKESSLTMRGSLRKTIEKHCSSYVITADLLAPWGSLPSY